MNINNPNSVITKAPEPAVQTLSDTVFDFVGITSCTNSSETCSTCARVGCCVAGFAVAGAAVGVGVNGLASLVAAKATPFACGAVVKLGALGGSIGGAAVGTCYPFLEHAAQMSQSAEPVITQPKTRKHMDNKAMNYHCVATSDKLELLLEDSSDDELIS